MSGTGEGRRRILDPIDRLSEVLFGLIMALTFTGSISVASQGREEIRTLLVGAVGCNTAWGIVDAFMYLLAAFTERGRRRVLVRGILEGGDPEASRRLLREALPSPLGASLPTEDVDRLRAALGGLGPVPRAAFSGGDFLGALGVFLLVFLSTVPVVIPFLIFREPLVALRVSNGVALLMLFVIGSRLGKEAGGRGFLMGAGLTGVGVLLVVITMLLGG